MVFFVCGAAAKVHNGHKGEGDAIFPGGLGKDN
jgi:hypothetical protein